jgi:CheY-like chemotaxis protein
VTLLVLVVDDEPDVEVLFRQHFRRDLRAGRFTMEFAQSAPAALQRIIDATGVSLILILSDINMPGMSGLELLPKAKALRPDVPVIMITAYGDADTKRKALENGADALLTKPIDFRGNRERTNASQSGPCALRSCCASTAGDAVRSGHSDRSLVLSINGPVDAWLS